MMLAPSNPHDWHQTHVEEAEWQRQRDQRKDDFPEIALDKPTLRLLKKIKASEEEEFAVDETDRHRAKMLLSSDFVTVKYFADSNGIIKSCKIRERGIHYLNYLSAEKSKERRQYAHNWKIAIFSALAGALLSEPIWSLIRWVVDSLGQSG